MKHPLFKAIVAFTAICICLPLMAQFRRTSDNAIYPFTTSPQSSDVFILGRPGDTNYNVSASNVVLSVTVGTNATARTNGRLVTISGLPQTPWLADENLNGKSGTNGTRLQVTDALTVGTLIQSNTSANISMFWKNGTLIWSLSPAQNNSFVPFSSYATGNKFVGTNVIGDPDAFTSIEGQQIFGNKIVGGASPSLTHNGGLIQWARVGDDVFYLNGLVSPISVGSSNGMTLGGGSVGIDVTGSGGMRFPFTNASAGFDANGKLTTVAGSSGTSVAVGTNLLASTNGDLVTIYGQPRIYLEAGDNVTIDTNGPVYTVHATASAGITTTGYTNASLITINDGNATPYPSTISSSGIAETITSVSVNIYGFNHNNPEDIAVILVSPSGHKIKLMEDTGTDALTGGPGNYANLVFSDSASAYVPAGTITNGTYLPTVRGSVGTPGSPVNTGPYYTNLSILHGTSPNGSWGLYVYDGAALDGGFITNWTLTINSGSADFARLSDPTNHWLGGAGFDGEVSFASGSIGAGTADSLDVNGDISAENIAAEGMTLTSAPQFIGNTNGYAYFDANGFLRMTNNGAGLTNVSVSASDTAFGSSWNGVTTVPPSKNAVYDWAHVLDSDDDGKVNVLDMGAGLVKTDSGGVVSAATAGTDYATHTSITNVYEFALSDETTAITTGTAKVTWRAPHAMTIKDLRASLSTASSSGIPTVDINEAGSTILSTKLTIDANETTSTTAAAAFVLSDSSLADDAEITFDIDVAGTGAKGLKVKIYYTR